MDHPANRLKKYKLRPNKTLGQHFLKDPAIAGFIVESAGIEPHDTVIEIGPGLGELTRFLAARAGRLIAVEIDAGLSGFLRDEFAAFPHVQIINQDFLKMDLAPLAREAGVSISVVGNLPYNIISPVLFKLMDHAELMRRATLMVQVEVAQRILASPGTRDYGLLSVLICSCAAVEMVIKVPPGAFHPKPKVESAVIALDFTRPHPRKPIDPAYFRVVVKAAFAMRRKMVKNGLAKAVNLRCSEAEINRALVASGINPQARAETLSLDQFMALSDNLLSPEP